MHLCPGLHAAAKFAIFRGLAKNRKIARSTIFYVHLRFFAISLVNDIGPIILRETDKSRGAVFTV